MHCASCEKLLKSEFGEIPGVQSVKIDLKNGTADITYNQEFNFSELKKTAQKFNYDAFEEKPKKSITKKLEEEIIETDNIQII